ncbi:hypothetical protein AgCh_038737 [Apium graveolens]
MARYWSKIHACVSILLKAFQIDTDSGPLIPEASAIDLVDEDAAKLKMEITSKPTELDEIELDEIDRAILKMEMELLVLL